MIGRTNVGGGSGGTGATLVVSAPSGVTVTAIKDDKTYTRVVGADGTTTFKGLSTGTWALSMSDSSHDPTTPVDVIITADYYVTLVLFSATINITYPAGSTCKAVHTDGTELTAPDTSGTWSCIVLSAGTWTVTATDGTNTTAQRVEITSDGQSESVILSYVLYLFREGIGQITPFTSKKETNSTISIDANGIVMNYASESYGQVAVGTANVVDLRNYSKLIFDAICNRTTTNNTYTDGAAVISTNEINYITPLSGFNAYNAMVPDGVRREYEIDIRDCNAEYYIGAKGLIDGTIYNIWLEE